MISASLLAGCAAGAVIAPQAASPPPAWASNVVAALAMLYPPPQTRLYVVKAPPGVAELLRQAGYGVAEGKLAGPAPRDGYRLVIETRALGEGSTAVIAHVGSQTLSRAYQDGGRAASGWSFDLTGATEAMKARVAHIQYPPTPVALLPAPETSR
jgi:hypothetical protein